MISAYIEPCLGVKFEMLNLIRVESSLEKPDVIKAYQGLTRRGRLSIKAVLAPGFLFAIFLLPLVSAQAEPGVYASESSANRAKGHYARARALLVEALSEFEQAKAIASPDLLLDSKKWQLSVVSRAEELNRVLDPKPLVSRDGARFRASALRVKHRKDQAPLPENAPYSVNYAGEEAIKLKKKVDADSRRAAEEAARARRETISREAEQQELREASDNLGYSAKPIRQISNQPVDASKFEPALPSVPQEAESSAPVQEEAAPPAQDNIFDLGAATESKPETVVEKEVVKTSDTVPAAAPGSESNDVVKDFLKERIKQISGEEQQQ